MSYTILMFIHLATVVPCFFIGAYLLVAKKGSPIHRKLGKIYLILMAFTAIVALFMEARVGPQLFNHFGWIHSFCLLTIMTVPRAYYTARTGNIRAHKFAMLQLYFGAIIIAGGFTFVPGRYLYELFFNGGPLSPLY